MPKRTDVPSWVTLTTDEQLLWHAYPSLWSVWRLLGVGLILIGLGISGAIFLNELLRLVSLAPIVVGLLVVGITYFSNQSIQYILTTEEIYKKSGLFSRNVTNIRVGRFQNTSYTQSFPERLMGFGSIHIATAGTSGTDLVLTDVPNPEDVNGLITEQLDAVSPQPEAHRLVEGL